MWADGYNYNTDVSQLCGGVLYDHIGASVDLRELSHRLVVVVLHLLCVSCSVFLSLYLFAIYLLHLLLICHTVLGVRRASALVTVSLAAMVCFNTKFAFIEGVLCP